MDRCPWSQADLYMRYHNTEWGVPVHKDRHLFEFLILEGDSMPSRGNSCGTRMKVQRCHALSPPLNEVSGRVSVTCGAIVSR
jgi:hypothetical protein